MLNNRNPSRIRLWTVPRLSSTTIIHTAEETSILIFKIECISATFRRTFVSLTVKPDLVQWGNRQTRLSSMREPFQLDLLMVVMSGSGDAIETNLSLYQIWRRQNAVFSNLFWNRHYSGIYWNTCCTQTQTDRQTERHTHARTHAHTHTHIHTHKHARTHARTHTHTHNIMQEK